MTLAVHDHVRERGGSTRLLTIYPQADQAQGRSDLEVVPWRPVDLLVALAFALLMPVARALHLPTRPLARTRGLRALLDADLVVDVAGISFVDGRGLPILGYNVLMTGIPLLVGTPVVKAAQAVGPFEQRREPMGRPCRAPTCPDDLCAGRPDRGAPARPRPDQRPRRRRPGVRARGGPGGPRARRRRGAGRGRRGGVRHRGPVGRRARLLRGAGHRLRGRPDRVVPSGAEGRARRHRGAALDPPLGRGGADARPAGLPSPARRRQRSALPPRRRRAGSRRAPGPDRAGRRTGVVAVPRDDLGAEHRHADVGDGLEPQVRRGAQELRARALLGGLRRPRGGQARRAHRRALASAAEIRAAIEAGLPAVVASAQENLRAIDEALAEAGR